MVFKLPPRTSAIASRFKIRPFSNPISGTGTEGGSLNADNESGTERAARAVGLSCDTVGAELRIWLRLLLFYCSIQFSPCEIPSVSELKSLN